MILIDPRQLRRARTPALIRLACALGVLPAPPPGRMTEKNILQWRSNIAAAINLEERRLRRKEIETFIRECQEKCG